MDNRTLWTIAVIAVCSLCTMLERALPFLVFRGRKVPEPVEYLGRVLPMAIIATLIFYCMRNVEFSSPASWAPQLISATVTVLLHLWRRSTMLSIAGGTICCMLLTQFVF